MQPTHDNSIDAMLEANKEIFNGIGKLHGTHITLNIDPAVPPRLFKTLGASPFIFENRLRKNCLVLKVKGSLKEYQKGKPPLGYHR